MKQFKISMIAVVAIVMGIAASAFTTRNTDLPDGWFSISSGLDPTMASSYTYEGNDSPCDGSDVLCAIKGTEDTGNPGHPRQADVTAAKTASSNFTVPVAGKVDFKDQ